jgi:hypothetical protein
MRGGNRCGLFRADKDPENAPVESQPLAPGHGPRHALNVKNLNRLSLSSEMVRIGNGQRAERYAAVRDGWNTF